MNWLVTGAASGIGAALAARLSACGTVLAIDRAPSAYETIQADLSDEASVARAADAAREWAARQGPFAGVALVAGVPGTAPPSVVMAVNLAAPVRLLVALGGAVAAKGSVVAVSSVTAHRCQWDDARLRALVEGGFPSALAASAELDGVAAYEVSKRALNWWVVQAAAAMHARRVRVNAVLPGPTQTPILMDFEQSMGKARLDAAAGLTGRHGRPDEIAAAIEWLLRGESGWVNGIELKVDGGFHALRAASAPSG